jgi:hypothetical protein
VLLARPKAPGTGPAWLLYATPPLVVWTLWWAALFPGIVSPDPLHELETLVAGRPNDWHPITHALLVHATVSLSGSFGLLTGLHVALTAALVGALLAAARRMGAPLGAALAACFAFALLPTYGGQAVAAWKDTTYGVAVLAAVWLLARGVEEGRLGRGRAAGLGLALGAIWLFRHPGLLLAGALAAGAAWLFPRERARVALAAGLCLALALAVRGPVKAALGVAPTPPLLTHHSVIHDLAAFVAAGVELPWEDEAALGQVLPLAAWRARYDCRGSGPLLFDPALSVPALERAAPRLVPLWLHLAAGHPAVLLRHRVCVTGFIWNPRDPAFIGPVGPLGAAVAENGLGIRHAPLLPRLAAWIADTKWALENSAWRVVLFAPATFLAVLLAACAAGLARARGGSRGTAGRAARRPAGEAEPARLLPVIALAALVNTGTYALLASSPEVRFQWPVTLLAPIAVALAAARPARAARLGVVRGGREELGLGAVPTGRSRG